MRGKLERGWFFDLALLVAIHSTLYVQIGRHLVHTHCRFWRCVHFKYSGYQKNTSVSIDCRPVNDAFCDEIIQAIYIT